MSFPCYFEGGPWDGEERAMEEVGPVLIVQMPAKQPPVFVSDPDEQGIVQIETAHYYRERVQHRYGCVTYFWTEEDRDRAAWGDVDDEYPSGMIETCQHPPTTPASTGSS